jgi:hypothetical protein
MKEGSNLQNSFLEICPQQQITSIENDRVNRKNAAFYTLEIIRIVLFSLCGKAIEDRI